MNRSELTNFIDNYNTTIIGRRKEFELLFLAFLLDGHVLLESVPGTGKTLLAKTFAQAMNGTFNRIQFTPDLLPSDITGIRFFHPKTQEFEWRLGPVFGNIILADEINRATPRTQSSLLEAMEERQVTIDGETMLLPSPFMVIATQNTVDVRQGTYELPVAQLDRFLFKIPFSYPSMDEERLLIQSYSHDSIHQLPPDDRYTIDDQMIKEMKSTIHRIHLSRVTEDYLLTIVQESREHPQLSLGISPRGTLALVKAAKGKAFLEGYDYVTPEHVKQIAPYVLTHRIIPSTMASLQQDHEQLIQNLIDTIPVPVE